MNRRRLVPFALLFVPLVLVPMSRVCVFMPTDMGPIETVFFWTYFLPAGLLFGGGDWSERALYIATTVFYTGVSLILAYGIVWLKDRRAR